MKEEKRGKLVPILIIAIIILVLIIAFETYMLSKAGLRLNDSTYANNQLNIENQNLIAENDRVNADIVNLTSQRDTLQKNYDLLYQDVQKIYKSCPTENACKGRFPGISWSCNNVGDDAIDPSHLCVCDPSCNLKATQIKN